MQEYLKDMDQEQDITLSFTISPLIREVPTLENLLSMLRTPYLFNTLTKIYVATDSTPVEMNSCELCSDVIGVVFSIEFIYGLQSGCSPYGKEKYDESTLHDLDIGCYNGTGRERGYTRHSFSSEIEVSSIIKLNNGDVLYMKEINSENFKKLGLIDYNFQCFTSAVTELFKFFQNNH
ncbi:uncharacterized protein EV154DRAFT_570667 [Mucor mucedo]|uniref:uncharacterized protein n=1 Tax=Mucor mucedo TaxID=29922 RepID=UPI002220F1E3|nr:uncharacterized protein EV154DRAFT_570667 [Mucor mucedo]KAI7871368.1 hypothetical protein EV154DRAFT_570667 [Mucor mucedo]